MIHKSTDAIEIHEKLKGYLLNKEVYKEIDEPILYHENSTFFFDVKKGDVIAFCCGFRRGKSFVLKYMFVRKDKRNTNSLIKMLESVESFAKENKEKIIQIVCPNNLVGQYKDNGYVVEEKYKRFTKVTKHL